jgi:uncharacterized protein (DUF58 family)
MNDGKPTPSTVESAPLWGSVGLPWIIVSVAILSLLLLAVFAKVYPTKRWLWCVLPLTVLSSLAVVITKFSSIGIVLVLFLDGLLLLVSLADLVTIFLVSRISVERQMIRTSSLGGTQTVKMIVENRGNFSTRLQIKDGVPEYLQATPEVHSDRLVAGQALEYDYTLTPQQRGVFRFETVYLRLLSVLGFWQQSRSQVCQDKLFVYPNMKQLAEYAILAKTNRLSLIGVRKTRKLGQDNNFERLRDCTQDDNYKHIDWRSTARRNKLTVKQFQTDQSQRVIFMLDCGRLMTSEYRGLSLLDYALNSILMLSYVALQQRDSVGLVCFSDRIESYVPISGGPSQMNRILHAGFDRFPSLRQSNFDQAFLHISKHCRKRSLVVLVTTIIDDVTAAQITGYLTNLIGRHLPLLCLLRDRAVFDFADNPDADAEVLYRSAAASQLLVWRNEIIQKMQRTGVLQVDAFPDALTTPLVNEYLAVKAKHLL